MPEPLVLGDAAEKAKSKEEEDSLIIVCGPPKLREAVGKLTTETMGWNNVFIYD